MRSGCVPFGSSVMQIMKTSCFLLLALLHSAHSAAAAGAAVPGVTLLVLKDTLWINPERGADEQYEARVPNLNPTPVP